MRRVWFALLLLLAAAVAEAQVVDPRAVDRIVNETLRAWQIPGAAIAIVRDDKVVLVKGYGVRELGGEAVTPDTLFQIASTSKAFTTTAMAMLVDEKKLKWDDPVRKHVEYLRFDDPCVDSMVTLRDVVSHRTGLGRHDELWDNSPWSREEVLRRIGQVAPARGFRSGYGYHNIMFIAAGEAVAHASGMPWDDFVRTRIFGPLSMTRTITEDEELTKSEHATGYRFDRTQQRPVVQAPIDTKTLGAGGAVKSTARDMANWLRFHLGNGVFDGQRLVSTEALNETKTPQTVIRVEGSTKESNPETLLEAYGMGWVVQDYKGELLVSHSGSLNGFRTHVDLLPKQNAGFVVLINVGRSYATVALRNALSDLLLGKPSRDWNAYYLALDRKAEMEAEKARSEREAKRQPDTTPSHDLSAYAGTYESRAYGELTIAVEDEALVLRWSRLAIPLVHYHYDTFLAVDELADVDEAVRFTTDPDGDIGELTVFGQRFVKK
ncbi:MAG TPA: serine hydrolase [Thermoanaerobaculia bacterium]|jgi:CubicO group peptidase (beta-lactamase class C family)